VGISGLDSSSSVQREVQAPCVHGNEPSGSIKGESFLY
jgi:hypothetical protein